MQKDQNNITISGSPHLIQDSVLIEEAIAENNSLKAQLFFSEDAGTAADKIYYSLPLFGLVQDNPFKDEVRYLPVDLGYTYSRILVYNILLPEGYSIEEKPENLSMVTPGKEAMFIYQARQQGNLLTIQVRLNIKESFIPVERYLSLRELYSKMINHCQKPYVISKN